MPLSIQTLHFFIEDSTWATNEITRTVINLHSILHIPQEAEDELRIHHLSSQDYLINPTRCGLESLKVSEKDAHRRLLLHCLRLMSATLKKNICDLDYSNPGIQRSEVEERCVQHLVPASEVVIQNPWITCNGYNVLWLHQNIDLMCLLSMRLRLPSGVLRVKFFYLNWNLPITIVIRGSLIFSNIFTKGGYGIDDAHVVIPTRPKKQRAY